MKKGKVPAHEISLGIIRADIISAKSAIDYYIEKGNKDIKNIAAYHLQQAAEKAYRRKCPTVRRFRRFSLIQESKDTFLKTLYIATHRDLESIS